MSFSNQLLGEVHELARQSLLASFGRAVEPDEPKALEAPGCCFVTLTKHGALRGCIGSLEPHRSLARDVIENSRSAAFSDPRFPVLGESELGDLEIEVSILGPHREIRIASEQELLEALEPGIDGLVLVFEGRRATFLPSVWEQLAEPVDFLQALKRKAGLPEQFWSEDMRWYRYGVQRVGGWLIARG
ncbi:AmmeMemoRadiSam system protein A [Marinobacterium lutimaris]|uniref:AMMECR1 domain-containing protein n=1 Tax=Marinobacterium lutimaris TaxID=568106 RepID=A0A1H5UU38_9GAMM|nr:AmmeMemoRadiSam system protein A [Marinobacterium lutimaris]SEF77727.1 hypothetical protein SAMN05444390_101477 [Marinobacterium lutimaris]